MSALRRTKIICTIGPASDSPKMLAALMNAGMNVARLNFSHGTHEEHRQRINLIRRTAEEKNFPVAILQDLGGPKLRTGPLAEPILLKTDDVLVLTNRATPSDAHPNDEPMVSVTYAELPAQMHTGDTILLADGTIQLRVIEKNTTDIRCRVVDGGILSSNKGINLPNRTLPIEALTDKDKTDLQFGLEMGVDCVALSFVRQANDIQLVKTLIAKSGRNVPVIAKIEKHEALQNIDAIIEAADGIMVARGDLAVETALEQVPLVQKKLIGKCNQVGKPVITATQMLRSMVDSPRPTRAEATDVANAVLDGTDAVMLSEETTIGKYPLETVQVMGKILCTTEAKFTPRDRLPTERQQGRITSAAAICHAVVNMARDLQVAAILAPTRSGTTARMVARYRPQVPIIALSHSQETMRWLSLVWGVSPIYIGAQFQNSDELIARCKQEALASGIVKPGETVLITAGLPPGEQSTTNLIKVEVLDT